MSRFILSQGSTFISWSKIRSSNSLPFGMSLSPIGAETSSSRFSPKCITKTHLFKYIENFTSKTENLQIKNSDIFHISAQNIDCGYSLELPHRGGSKEYPHSMFLCRNKKNNVYPCKAQFYCIKMGFKGVKII